MSWIGMIHDVFDMISLGYCTDIFAMIFHSMMK